MDHPPTDAERAAAVARGLQERVHMRFGTTAILQFHRDFDAVMPALRGYAATSGFEWTAAKQLTARRRNRQLTKIWTNHGQNCTEPRGSCATCETGERRIYTQSYQRTFRGVTPSREMTATVKATAACVCRLRDCAGCAARIVRVDFSPAAAHADATRDQTSEPAPRAAVATGGARGIQDEVVRPHEPVVIDFSQDSDHEEDATRPAVPLTVDLTQDSDPEEVETVARPLEPVVSDFSQDSHQGEDASFTRYAVVGAAAEASSSASQGLADEQEMVLPPAREYPTKAHNNGKRSEKSRYQKQATLCLPVASVPAAAVSVAATVAAPSAVPVAAQAGDAVQIPLAVPAASRAIPIAAQATTPAEVHETDMALFRIALNSAVSPTAVTHARTTFHYSQ
jgi:hypothetical protein